MKNSFKMRSGRTTTKPVTKPKLAELIDLYGSQLTLAKVLDINQSRISCWLHEDTRMPSVIAEKIEELTEGKFPKTSFGPTTNYPLRSSSKKPSPDEEERVKLIIDKIMKGLCLIDNKDVVEGENLSL